MTPFQAAILDALAEICLALREVPGVSGIRKEGLLDAALGCRRVPETTRQKTGKKTL